jgi:hypothetical protein
MRIALRWCFPLILITLLGCKATHESRHTASSGEFHQVQGAGITNFFQLSRGIYSGAAPEGGEGFDTLRNLGVKTILSVDGSTPQVDLAAKYGLRYVHIPVGYDGITLSNEVMIIKAVKTLPEPVFIHCHHGQHRGPTAAAIICEDLEGWTPHEAEAWLRVAGTSTNYPGLFRTVREFKAPTESELRQAPNKFPSRARTPDLVNTMVQVDEHFDTLKAMQKSGFKPLPDHPDATSASESLMLYELFHEAHRTKQGSTRGQKFLLELTQADTNASALHASLEEFQRDPSMSPQKATAAFENLGKNCATCHKTFRN